MPAGSRTCLVASAGGFSFSLPIADVVETMRPLPVVPLGTAPSFVLGVAILRGAPAPVVCVATLAGSSPRGPFGRFVSARSEPRRVLLAVDRVLGIRDVSADVWSDLPLLLSSVSSAAVASIGVLDESLVLLLESARIVPDEVWTTLDAGAGATA